MTGLGEERFRNIATKTHASVRTFAKCNKRHPGRREEERYSGRDGDSRESPPSGKTGAAAKKICLFVETEYDTQQNVNLERTHDLGKLFKIRLK